MKTLAAVVQREIRERRLLFVGALLLGLVPLLLPFLPLRVAGPPAELRSATAVTLACVLAAVLGVGLGTSFLVGDLATGRLRFYLSLPLRGTALYFGKLAAALLTAVACVGLVLLPSALLGDPLRPAVRIGAVSGLLLVLLAILATLLLFHALALALRARSPWALADLAAVVALAFAVATLVRRLGRWPGQPILVQAWPWLAGATLLALVAGSAIPFLRARTELDRAHRLQVVVLWPLLGLVLASFVLYARWWLAPSPEDLSASTLSASSSSNAWVVVTGALHGRGGEGTSGEFVLDTRHGVFERLEVLPDASWGTTRFSADGRHLLWLEREFFVEGGGRVTLETLDLESLRRRSLEAESLLGWTFDDLDLSPDGQVFAAAQSFRGAHRLTLLRLADGQVVASLPLPIAGWALRLRFLDGRRVRIVTCDLELSAGDFGAAFLGSGKCRTLLVDAARGALLADASWQAPANSSWDLSPDTSRVLVRSADARRLYDVDDGRLLATIPRTTGETSNASSSSWLGDGSLLLLDRGGSSSVAIHVSPAGELRRAALPGRLLAAGALDDRKVAVLRFGGLGESFLLDLADFSLRRLANSTRPVSWGWAGSPGGAAARLFVRDAGALLDVDPATGVVRELARLRR